MILKNAKMSVNYLSQRIMTGIMESTLEDVCVKGVKRLSKKKAFNRVCCNVRFQEKQIISKIDDEAEENANEDLADEFFISFNALINALINSVGVAVEIDTDICEPDYSNVRSM